MINMAGETIGTYWIEALLGEDTLARTYRAVDLASNGNLRTRFIDEANAAATLTYPNIVEISDVNGRTGDDPPYMVMAFIAGSSLRHVLRQSDGTTMTPLSLGIDLVRQAADGLAYAHRREVIHGYIKPERLLLA